MAYENIVIPSAFIGCTFADTTWTDGTLLTTKGEPVVLGDRSQGNILFPVDWTKQQRADYRRENNLPGAEWGC